MIDFTLNGRKVEFDGPENLPLLKYLRNEQGIITPKDGCSCQGACGACTVEMDGKAILSCVTPMRRVAGKSVITTDGLEQKVQDAFSRAFVEKGGIQCGFCTPGIVMSAKVLLIQNRNPTVDDIKKAIHKNICRCTGYKKIIDSILFVAEILRGEVCESEESDSGKVGTRLPKYDAYDTVLGMRPFVCDLKEEGMLYAALKFSDHPRAKIKSIDVSKAESFPGVKKVVTSSDVPGEKMVGLIVKDWPFMLGEGEITRCLGDVLAGVVAESEEIARAAMKKIVIDYEVYEPITNVDKVLRNETEQVHPDRDNILSTTRINQGDTKKAFAEAAYISKGTYYSQRIEHAFLEPECCMAVPSKWGLSNEDELTVYSQGQGPYVDRLQIAAITTLPLERINIVQVQNGGGFGGKEDMTVQGHAALYALLVGAPVRVALTREESMCMHPKRHPMRMRYKLACDKDGILTALRVRIHGDTGAYASVGAKVLERAAGHAAGGYEVKNIDLVALATYTNNVPCGAMRGFGVNQTAFAIDSCIDDLCEQGGFDRWKFRYNNVLVEGSTIATGQKLSGGIGLKETLLAVKDEFYNAKYAGISCGIKNTGIGNGVTDEARAKIVVDSAEKIIIHHGWTEMGQGVHTMAIHTVCEETGLSPELMEVKVETKEDVFCGMTTSSRGTSMVGNSLINASKKLMEDLKNHSLEELQGKVYQGYWACDWTTDPENCPTGIEQVTHYSYGYATQVAILDEKTGKLDRIIAAHDAGKIMNPTLFEGQIEGGVHMGAGYALTENFPYKDGRPVHTKFGKLGILRAKDTPRIDVIGVEAGDTHGPYGAKGVGEIGLVPTAAAIANAIYQFDKIRRYSLPIGMKKK